jgi:hypothetical protein
MEMKTCGKRWDEETKKLSTDASKRVVIRKVKKEEKTLKFIQIRQGVSGRNERSGRGVSYRYSDVIDEGVKRNDVKVSVQSNRLQNQTDASFGLLMNWWL